MKTQSNPTLKKSQMLLFDIGANRGDAVLAGLKKGYKVIALEAAPKVYGELVKNFIYNPNVVPLKFAVSDKDYEQIEFYEADEDGLSTMNLDWLTKEDMPYAGKPYRTVSCTTITIDTLVEIYGEPNLIKIDVEGAEWAVLKGMTKKYKTLAFEWTFETIKEHEQQLNYLYSLGYTEVAPQYITHHLERPRVWLGLHEDNTNKLLAWHQETSDAWIDGGWKMANLRPTADVGMLWLR
jgi:FkbM family methyltransferase